MQSLSVSAHTAGVPAPAALALCRRCQRSLRQACQGRSWERAQRRNAAAHALAPWAGDVSGPMEGSAHASGALVPRWRGVWRRGGNRTLHRGNGHFNSCSVPSYFFGLTVWRDLLLKFDVLFDLRLPGSRCYPSKNWRSEQRANCSNDVADVLDSPPFSAQSASSNVRH